MCEKQGPKFGDSGFSKMEWPDGLTDDMVAEAVRLA
jgi:hypothetical protein